MVCWVGLVWRADRVLAARWPHDVLGRACVAQAKQEDAAAVLPGRPVGKGGGRSPAWDGRHDARLQGQYRYRTSYFFFYTVPPCRCTFIDLHAKQVTLPRARTDGFVTVSEVPVE